MKAPQRIGPRRRRLTVLGIILVAVATAGCGRPSNPPARWATAVGGQVITDPVLTGDRLIVQAGDGLVAIGTSSGEVMWRQRSLGAAAPNHPVIAGDLALEAGRGHLLAFAAKTGSPQWMWKYPEGVPGVGNPAVAAGLVYVADDQTRRIHVLDSKTGTVRTTLQVAITNRFQQSVLTVVGGRILVQVWQDRRLYAFDSATGSMSWSAAIPGDNGSDAVLAGESVYVASDGGTLSCVDAATGSVRWTSHLGGPGLAAPNPSIADRVVFASFDDKQVHALAASTGARLWSATTGDRIEGSPVEASGTVYAGADDGGLYALDAATGALKGMTHPGIVGTAPVVSAGIVYAASIDGKVYAYDVGAFR